MCMLRQDVAHDQSPIGLAPERNVADRVPGRFQDLKSAHLVTFAKLPTDRMRGPLPDFADLFGQPGFGHPRHHESFGFHGVGIPGSAPKRQPESRADRMAGPLVVRVHVRQGDCIERPALHLSKNSACREPGPAIHEHPSHHINVNDKRRKAVEDVEIIGQSLHGLSSRIDHTRMGIRNHDPCKFSAI